MDRTKNRFHGNRSIVANVGWIGSTWVVLACGCSRNGADAAPSGSAPATFSVTRTTQPPEGLFLPTGFAVQRATTLGGVRPRVADINRAGQAVGTTQVKRGTNFFGHATIWTNGDILLPPVGERCAADAISDSGVAVGTFDDANSEFSRGVRWQGDKADKLPTLKGYQSIYVEDVNDSGAVTGYVAVNYGLRFRAFVIIEERPVDLGTLGGTGSMAHAINSLGQIAGLSDLTPSREPAEVGPERPRNLRGSGLLQGPLRGAIPPSVVHCRAVLWHPKGVPMPDGVRASAAVSEYQLVNLGTLGGTDSKANDINDSGQVVGASKDSQGLRRAFLWHNGTMVPLTPPEDGPSEAFSINNHGIVVGAFTGSEYSRPFLYWQGNLCQLASLLPDDYAWDSINVRKVTDSGVILAEDETEELRDGKRERKGQLLLVPTGWEKEWTLPAFRSRGAGISVSLTFTNSSGKKCRFAVIEPNGHRPVYLYHGVDAGKTVTVPKARLTPAVKHTVATYSMFSNEKVELGTLEIQSNDEGKQFSFTAEK